MKKLLFLTVLSLMLNTPASAAIKTIGSHDTLSIDSSGFPADMKAKYNIMKVKCIKCHTLERAVIALQTGIAPISGQIFDRTATKAYGIKMMRKPDSNMSKEETSAVVQLLNFLLDEAAR